MSEPAYGDLRVVGPPGHSPTDIYLIVSSDMVNELGQGVLAVPVQRLELEDDPVTHVVPDHGVASLYEIHHWPHSWIGDKVGQLSPNAAADVARKIRNLIGN